MSFHLLQTIMRTWDLCSQTPHVKLQCLSTEQVITFIGEHKDKAIMEIDVNIGS